MSLASVVNAMAKAGCSAEQIASVVEQIDEARRSKSRAGNAERQRRFREAHNGNNAVTKRDEALPAVTERDNRDETSESRAPAFFIGEDSNYIPPSETTSLQAPLKAEIAAEKPKSPKRQNSGVLEILEAVLQPEVAAGVIDHRKKLRKPLTAMAAQGLAKQFAATGCPDAAARMMVERGWQGFKPEWFENDRSSAQPRAGPLQSKRPTWEDTASWFLRGEDDDGSRREESSHEVVELSREDWTRA